MRTGEMIKSDLLCQLPHSGSWRDSQTFSANRVQQASYPMSNSHKSRGEFGIKAIRYVNYRVAVGGEMTIGFSPNRVQRASYLMSHSHKSRGIRLLASNGLLSPCFAMYTKKRRQEHTFLSA